MNKKIMVSLLSVFLMAVLITAAASPSSVMAVVGLKSLEKNFLEKVKADTIDEIKTGLRDLSDKMGERKNKVYPSKDNIVFLSASKDKELITLSIVADASSLPDMNYKDYGKVIKVVKELLKPVFSEKQATGLCSLLFGDALSQYNKGLKKIEITKEYEGLTIKCSGDINTGLITVDLKSELGVKKCPPDTRKVMETKASRR